MTLEKRIKMTQANSLKLICQKHVIETGGQTYPFFLGAVSAKDLALVAMAPSFKPETHNHEIATGVLNPPTKNWQRPLFEENVLSIRDRFDTAGEIMPNPVLLAVNPDFENLVTLTEQKMNNDVPTGLWEIVVNKNLTNEEMPLWIIDGQHRVKGLSLTETNNPPLPFVILHSNERVYLPQILAKIFAQVTTMARALDPIHHAWMQYVFSLGKYLPNSVDSLAMETVALLCSTQQYKTKANEFYNKIQFNPEKDLTPIQPGGFAFDAKYLHELIRDKYFKNPGTENMFSPKEVAEQIALAINALKDTARNINNTSAFFGLGHYEQKYFRDGFIAGVCSYLIHNGKPDNWVDVLKDLNFHGTDWDVSSWVDTTGGRAGSISKKLAFDCFEQIFADGSLPGDVSDICNYLQGKGTYLLIEYKLIGSNNQLISRRSGEQSKHCELVGGVQTVPISLPRNTRWIKITSPCKNLGPVDISREGHKFDEEFHFTSFKRGKEFNDAQLRSLKDTIQLEVKADLYGNLSVKKKLKIKLDSDE